MFRKMIATGCLVTSLMAVGGPAFAITGVGDDLADPRPSPAVDVTDLIIKLADPRPSPIVVK